MIGDIAATICTVLNNYYNEKSINRLTRYYEIKRTAKKETSFTA